MHPSLQIILNHATGNPWCLTLTTLGTKYETIRTTYMDPKSFQRVINGSFPVAVTSTSFSLSYKTCLDFGSQRPEAHSKPPWHSFRLRMPPSLYITHAEIRSLVTVIQPMVSPYFHTLSCRFRT